MNHHEPGIGVELILTELLVVVLLAASAAYLAAARRARAPRLGYASRLLVVQRPVSDERHSRRNLSDERAARQDWPAGRTVLWLVGIAVAVIGVVGSAVVPHDLRLHVVGHLLVGMVAPLLLVRAAPMTLALRALPRRHARALARLLRARPVAVLTHPAVAAVVDVGGLWLMYRTDLLIGVPGALVNLHMLLAGCLFAFSIAGRDPAPHRPGLAVRAAVLVAAVAAHDVLAKLLYAAQAETAGMLMYYGAAPVHVVLFVRLGREWYVAQGRRQRSRDAALIRAAASRTAASMPGRVSASQTACSAASEVENASQIPGAAARINAGEGRPSIPPRTTPASRASSMPAATSHSLVPASTAQSSRPHAR